MDKNLKKLLCNLEPEINKKCFEIQEKKRERRIQRVFILASILLLTIPSFLIMLGISMFIGIVCFILIALVVMLPFVIKEERGVCYE